MTLGERISVKRKSKGYSQEYLAQYIGVSRQAVHKWEKDLSAPDTYNLIALAQVLDTTVEYIVKGDENSPVPRTIAKRKLPKVLVYTMIVTVTALITCTATVLYIFNAPVSFDAGACGSGFSKHIYDKYADGLIESNIHFITNYMDITNVQPIDTTHNVQWEGKSIYLSFLADVTFSDGSKTALPFKFIGERKWIESYSWTMVHDAAITEKTFIIS